MASSAKDEAAGVKEAAERSADEQRRALQQEQDRTKVSLPSSPRQSRALKPGKGEGR